MHALLRLVVPLAIFCSIFGSRAANAQSEGAAAAQVLFDQGREAMLRRDYDTACQRFRESEQIDPAPGTKLNLADCEEKRGRIASAWELFRAVIRELPESDERHGIAVSRAAALEKRLPTLVLRLAPGTPSTTRVRVGTSEIGSGSFGVPLPLDPGKHTLVIEAPGHQSRTVEVVLVGGSAQTVDVVPGTATASSRQPGPAAIQLPARERSGGTKTLGYVLGGIGLVGIAVGTVAGVIVLSKWNTNDEGCDDAAQTCSKRAGEARQSGEAIAPISTAGFVVGALGLGAGAYFILTSDANSETAIRVRAAPGTSQISLLRRW
jgi:hypothetical protein